MRYMRYRYVRYVDMCTTGIYNVYRARYMRYVGICTICRDKVYTYIYNMRYMRYLRCIQCVLGNIFMYSCEVYEVQVYEVCRHVYHKYNVYRARHMRYLGTCTICRDKVYTCLCIYNMRYTRYLRYIQRVKGNIYIYSCEVYEVWGGYD